MKKTIVAFFAGFLTVTSYSHAISLDYIKRGFQNCTGHCDKENIACMRGVNKQGFYDWCEKNCTHDSKKDLNKFIDALKYCDQGRSANSSAHTNAKVEQDFARLGLDKNASKADATNAYRKLALKVHPEKNPGKDTTEEFKDLNEDYQYLLNTYFK